MKNKKLRFEVEEKDEEDDWDDWEDDEEEKDDIIDNEKEVDDGSNEIEDVPKSKKRIKGPKPGSRKRERTKKALVWAFRGFVVILVLVLIFAPIEPFETIREKTGINKLKDLARPFTNFPEWVNVTVTMTYDVAITGGSVDEMRIQVAPPFDIPFGDNTKNKAYVLQDVLDIRFTPINSIDLIDYNNDMNRVSGWDFEDERGPQLALSVTYDMTLHTYKWDISEKDSGRISDIPEYYTTRYLTQEWVVDLDNDGDPDTDREGKELYRYDPKDPDIVNLAEDLTKDEETVYGKIKAIYDHIQDEFTYTTPTQREDDRLRYGSYPKWATGCLADGYGDCDDQSLLMASLCRAIGIPAWLEIGYLYDPMEGSWGGHGWFNVAIPVKDDDGNIRSDPVIAPIDPVNHEFLFRDPYRITDWIDD
ncbi:MAG: transglutaminase-like domain-containing protein, partial [Candidatus Thermoplasmatota archaeon]|nr:transglutaminase-like domain-containing protein [Candidatus Thermoplasmatota archaeon]